MIGSKGLIIDIGTSEVRGLLFTSFLGKPRIERTESVAVEDENRSDAVKRLLAIFPSDASVTLQLPGCMFMVRTVSLPFSDRKKVRKVLPLEMEGLIPVPIDDVMLDSVHSTNTEKGSRIMALAIMKRSVAEFTSLFPDGRRPERIIPDFLALASIGVRIKTDDKGYGVLNFDKTAVSMVLFSDGRPVSMRSTTPADADSIRKWVSETIKGEGETVKRLYITGRDPVSLSGIAEESPLSPLLDEEGGEWSVLAGGAISASEFPWFNILGLSSDSERTEKLIKIISIGAAILIALWTGDLFLRYRTSSQNLAALKAQTRKVFQSALPGVTRIVKEDAQLKDALKKEKELKEALVGKPTPSYTAAFKGIEKIAGEHSELKIREIAVEGYSISISGDGNGITADGIKKIFSGIEGTKEAMVEEMTQGIAANSYRFRVKVGLK